MTGKIEAFIRNNNTMLRALFSELIDEKTQRVLGMPAGEERDRQIEFIKAFREWIVVLDQFDSSKKKSTLMKEAI